MHPDIQRYQTDPLYAYLNKKAVTLPGLPPHVPKRDILIMAECGVLSFRLGQIRGSIELRPDDGMNRILDKLYAPLAACSFGDVPTMDEFLALPNEDIHIWLTEARTVNAGYFAWIDAAEKIVEKLSEDELKKKERKPRKSARK